jgi:Bacterial Ig-like domain (group 3)
VKRLALVVAAGVLPATAQVATVTTVSSLNPDPAAQIVRFTAQLQFAPGAGAYSTGTITFRCMQTPATAGRRNVQTFGSTIALTTQASIVVSTLSAGSYVIPASFSGDNVYAPSTSSPLNQVLTPPSVGITPTIN